MKAISQSLHQFSIQAFSLVDRICSDVLRPLSLGNHVNWSRHQEKMKDKEVAFQELNDKDYVEK